MANPTTIKLTDDDRKVADYIRQQTGVQDTSSIIRLALRESAGLRSMPGLVLPTVQRPQRRKKAQTDKSE